MTKQEDEGQLTAEQLGAIDKDYTPFPAFSSWPKSLFRMDLWDQDYSALREVAEGASEDHLKAAHEIATRTAAFDSGAIEGLYRTDRGLTFTVATQALAWEEKVAEDGSDVLALFQGQLEAFEMVVDLVAERYPRMTGAWVRKLHEVITAAQDSYVVQTPLGPQRQPLPKGEYKAHPNHVRTADGRVHAYAPVDMTQSEMQRLLDELDTKEFKAAHPALQASYVHYAFVVVHPFADGNGRVARALASVFTYRAASVPLLALAHQRDEYFASLARADEGAAGEFISFVAKSCREAMEMVTENLKTAQASQPEDVLAEFRQIYLAQGELSHQELDALANAFTDDLVEMLNVAVSRLSLPDGLEIRIIAGSGGSQDPIPSGFRSVVSPGSRFVQIEMKAAPPAAAELKDALQIFVSRESDPATSVIVRARDSGESLVFGQTDLVPTTSSAAQVRLENFVRRWLGADLEALLKASRRGMERQGY
jgi:Fic family protein